MASRRSTTLFTLPLAALLGLCGCAQNLREAPTVEQAEENANAMQAEYVIGANDTLAINVWRETELALRRWRSNGKISVPLLDDVRAADLRPTGA
jgi:protein involved in polysaccharide export with SLBB domain